MYASSGKYCLVRIFWVIPSDAVSLDWLRRSYRAGAFRYNPPSQTHISGSAQHCIVRDRGLGVHLWDLPPGAFTPSLVQVGKTMVRSPFGSLI